MIGELLQRFLPVAGGYRFGPFHLQEFAEYFAIDSVIFDYQNVTIGEIGAIGLVGRKLAYFHLNANCKCGS